MSTSREEPYFDILSPKNEVKSVLLNRYPQTPYPGCFLINDIRRLADI